MLEYEERIQQVIMALKFTKTAIQHRQEEKQLYEIIDTLIYICVRILSEIGIELTDERKGEG